MAAKVVGAGRTGHMKNDASFSTFEMWTSRMDPRSCQLEFEVVTMNYDGRLQIQWKFNFSPESHRNRIQSGFQKSPSSLAPSGAGSVRLNQLCHFVRSKDCSGGSRKALRSPSSESNRCCFSRSSGLFPSTTVFGPILTSEFSSAQMTWRAAQIEDFWSVQLHIDRDYPHFECHHDVLQ